eukprot:scaffold58345_cov62-Phaeocystis_antarctica.AAC.4
MTNASTPLDARKADLSSTDMPSRVGSAINLQAAGTPTDPSSTGAAFGSAAGSSGWPCTLSSLVTQVAWAMTKLSTPLEARNADFSSTDMPSSAGLAMNLHASGTPTAPVAVAVSFFAGAAAAAAGAAAPPASARAMPSPALSRPLAASPKPSGSSLIALE